MAKRIVKVKVFPKEIFAIYRENGGELQVIEKQYLSHGRRAATYKLVKVGKAKVKTTVE